MPETEPLPSLPPGIRARFVPGVNGLNIHVLEAGYETAGRPCLLLLHGFPELAFSWRKVMGPLAAAGYHVIAPDQRGYGRTTGWSARYEDDPAPFRLLNIVRDAMGLVAALGIAEVAAIVGHDFGSPVAAWCGLLRPDVFRRVVLMSAPFPGPPALNSETTDWIHRELSRLVPPRKHYQMYYSTREANADMLHARQGIHDFLRAYFHMKSADWPGNRPFPLNGWNPSELAKLPRYYVMDRDQGMAGTVAPHMPSAYAIAGCQWLPDDELSVYAREYARTGFQGGLLWYRCRIDQGFEAEMQIFSGRALEVPALFIAGRNDWGIHQVPGAFERMQGTACPRMHAPCLIDGAGHWVQQERPQQVIARIVEFLKAEAP